MATGAVRLEKIVTFLEKELRPFRCRVIWTGPYYTLRRVIWTTILCRYCEIINHVSYCGTKHYAGEFYTWIGVLDTRVHSSYQEAESSRLFVGKFLTGPYYTMRRVIWTVTMRSLITFLSYILCPLGATQVSFKRGLRRSIWGCIIPASKLKFHDYL